MVCTECHGRTNKDIRLNLVASEVVRLEDWEDTWGTPGGLTAHGKLRLWPEWVGQEKPKQTFTPTCFERISPTSRKLPLLPPSPAKGEKYTAQMVTFYSTPSISLELFFTCFLCELINSSRIKCNLESSPFAFLCLWALSIDERQYSLVLWLIFVSLENKKSSNIS